MFSPSVFMYNGNTFKRPKEPYVGMKLGSFKSSIEAKLWLKLYLVYGQDRQRSINVGHHRNDAVVFGCSKLAGMCPFKVRIKKHSGSSSWTVLTADLDHSENCESTDAILDTQLQIYMNLDVSNDTVSPQSIMVKTHALMKTCSSCCGDEASINASIEFNTKSTGYRSSKRASYILKSIVPRKIVFNHENNTSIMEAPSAVAAVVMDDRSHADAVSTNSATFKHRITYNCDHVKPYGWSPIHHWINIATYRKSLLLATANLPCQKLEGDHTNRTFILTLDIVPFDILWTEIMEKIFRWRCEEEDVPSIVSKKPTTSSLLYSAPSMATQKFYYAPHRYKHMDSFALDGIHKFKAVEGERLLRSFVSCYGVSGQSLVRMHTELHCCSYNNDLVYVVIYEYPLVWAASNGYYMANPPDYVENLN